MNSQRLKLAIDSESINIYREQGEGKDPIHIAYWHEDEWVEDPSIVPAIANAVSMVHSAPRELLSLLGLSDLIIDEGVTESYKSLSGEVNGVKVISYKGIKKWLTENAYYWYTIVSTDSMVSVCFINPNDKSETVITETMLGVKGTEASRKYPQEILKARCFNRFAESLDEFKIFKEELLDGN